LNRNEANLKKWLRNSIQKYPLPGILTIVYYESFCTNNENDLVNIRFTRSYNLLSRGDVTRIEKIVITGPFNFFLDGGCFHGMSEAERGRYNNSISQVAASDSELLIFSFGPSKRGIPPRGAEIDDVERCFSDNWKIIWSIIDRDIPDTLKDTYVYAAW
jgi:hypothetical protein